MARKRPEPEDFGGPSPVPKHPPNAFEVADFGQGAGFGVVDASGSGLDAAVFKTRQEAAQYAARIKAAFYAGMADGFNAPTPAQPAPRARNARGQFVPAGSPSSAPSPTPSPSPAPASSTATPSTQAPTGRGPAADAFEQAFDVSIGRAIFGAEKIVAASVAVFRKSFEGVKAALANPGSTVAGFSSAASQAAFASTVVAAFASARVRNAVASAVSGFVPTAVQLGSGVGRGFAGFAGQAAQRAAQGATAAFHAVQAGAGFGGTARAFGAGFGGTAGSAMTAFAGLASEAASVAVGFAALVRQMTTFAESVVEGNRGLARWNGAIASAYIGLAIGDFRRNVRLGRATQGSAITAAHAVDQMRDDFMGVNILRANVQNRAAGFAASFAGGVGADLSKFADRVNAKIEQVDPQGLVSAGAGAGLWEGIKTFGKTYYDSFMNDPATALNSGGLVPFFQALFAGQKAAAAGADAKVVKLAQGNTDPNFWGAGLRDFARGGPLLRRPAPRP